MGLFFRPLKNNLLDKISHATYQPNLNLLPPPEPKQQKIKKPFTFSFYSSAQSKLLAYKHDEQINTWQYFLYKRFLCINFILKQIIYSFERENMNIHTCLYCDKKFHVNISLITKGENGTSCSGCHSGGKNPAQYGKAWVPIKKRSFKKVARKKVILVMNTSTRCRSCNKKYHPKDVGLFGGEDLYCDRCNPFRR